MEVVFRAVVVFCFLWLITRAVGRSTLGELSTFELMLYVTMGDLVQQGITQQDFSLTSAILAVGVFALLTVALSYANWRWPRLRPVTHGVPVIVVSDGEPQLDTMRAERLSLDDLMAAAREQGVERQRGPGRLSQTLHQAGNLAGRRQKAKQRAKSSGPKSRG